MPILLATIMLLSVTACSSDDDSETPPIIYDIVTVHSDAHKTVSSVTTDDGKCWTLTQPVTADQTDSTFRCFCGYIDEGGLMKLCYLEQIYSNSPIKAERFLSRPTDPLNVVALWNSGGYINMHLGIKTTNSSPHAFSFCEDSISNGKAYITLIHLQPIVDAESFTKAMYISMPLRNYADNDSVIIRIKTYSGLYSRTFAVAR